MRENKNIIFFKILIALSFISAIFGLSSMLFGDNIIGLLFINLSMIIIILAMVNSHFRYYDRDV